MGTLKDYFSYELDSEELSSVFEDLSRQLKIIHSNNMVVPDLTSNEIIFNQKLSFKTIEPSNNFEAEKRNNIIAFAKIIIGSYLSIGTGFIDFSLVDNSWFIENFDTIFSTVHEENFDEEYFRSVFLEGKNYYYSDYLDRKKQSEALQGKSNIQGYRKVLRNAGSSLYEEMSGEYEDNEDEIKEKNANLKVLFNPMLIGIMFVIITFVLIIISLMN